MKLYLVKYTADGLSKKKTVLAKSERGAQGKIRRAETKHNEHAIVEIKEIIEQGFQEEMFSRQVITP